MAKNVAQLVVEVCTPRPHLPCEMRDAQVTLDKIALLTWDTFIAQLLHDSVVLVVRQGPALKQYIAVDVLWHGRICAAIEDLRLIVERAIVINEDARLIVGTYQLPLNKRCFHDDVPLQFILYRSLLGECSQSMEVDSVQTHMRLDDCNDRPSSHPGCVPWFGKDRLLKESPPTFFSARNRFLALLILGLPP